MIQLADLQTPQLTQQQSNAYKLMLDMDMKNIFIGGVAGSGKSFTISHATADLSPDSFVVLAPTHKAAENLRKRGTAAQTIHSFLYRTSVEFKRDDAGEIELDDMGRPTEVLHFGHVLDIPPDEKSRPFEPPETIIIEECSMVGQDLYQDLLRLQHECHCRLIFIGDPWQLPPVKDADVFQTRKPDVFLTEIHRQALDNPVLALSAQLRERNLSALAEFTRGYTVNKDLFKEYVIDNEAQIICWTNKMRRYVNSRVRQHHGWNNMLDPQIGEELISISNSREQHTWNGQTIRLKDVVNTGSFFIFTDNQNASYEANPHPFIDYATSYGKVPWSRTRASFDYCYAVTAHKAQGSEWERVVVIDETARMGKAGPEFKFRWLYTAVTRTRNELHILKS